MKKQTVQRFAAAALTAVIALSSLPGIAFADGQGELDYIINNPYASVDWAGYDQYKADFHAHSKNSDGGNLTYEMVEDHYE